MSLFLSKRLFITFWNDNQKNRLIWLEELSGIVYRAAGFENFITQELIIVAKLRNMNGYENMSRQQLENIFTTPSSLKHTVKSASWPKKHTPTTGSTPAPRPKSLTPAL